VIAGGALAAVGCSSGEGTIDAGLTDAGLTSCAVEDLCAQITVAQVTAACGTSAASTKYESDPGDPSADICYYDGAFSDTFEIGRLCTGSSARAREYYDIARPMEFPGFVAEDVTGLGDAAFFRYSEQTKRGQLYILSGNRFVYLYDNEATDKAGTQACLTGLVSAVLAAR